MEALLTGCLVGFSLILLFISLAAYRRTGSARFALVGAAFFIFFLKGVLLFAGMAWGGFSEGIELLALDILVLLFLYFAIAKG